MDTFRTIIAVPAALFPAALALQLRCRICSSTLSSVSPYVTVSVANNPRYFWASYPVLLRKVSCWAAPDIWRSTRSMVIGVISALKPMAFGSSVVPAHVPDVRPDFGMLLIPPWNPRKSSEISAAFKIPSLVFDIHLASSAKTGPHTVIGLYLHCEPHFSASSFPTRSSFWPSSPWNLLSTRYGALPTASSWSCNSQS